MKKWYLNASPIIRYFLNSCFVTVIDVIFVWVFARLFGINIVVANTIGVVMGFLIDYVLSKCFVFDEARGKSGFAIYLVTFLFGLVLADWLIYWSSISLFMDFEKDLNILLSKGFSIVVPFFVLYFLRKFLYHVIKNGD